MLRFICVCGQRMNAPDRLAGTTVSCLGCRAPIVVPRVACQPTGRMRFELEIGGREPRIVPAPALQPAGAPAAREFRVQPAQLEVVS